jgi:hypothetical protein
MYAGAAASLTGIIVDLATKSATVSAMQSVVLKSGAPLTPSQVSSGETNTLALIMFVDLIGVGLWIFIARASMNGQHWARTTGSVLFGLDTLALLIGPSDVGLHAPAATLARIFAGIIWLAGLGAVVFLWRKDSGAFLQARRSP